jgi:signal transduction histidine kinase
LHEPGVGTLTVPALLVLPLSNAAKFGAGAPIEVRIERMAELARLSVRDHGLGVDPAQQARIFERFVRLNGGRHAEGAGLGLAITQAVAEAHGGRVELDSRPGAGARFTVIIPTEPPQEVRPA